MRLDRSSVMLLLLVVGGCSAPNPAFEPDKDTLGAETEVGEDGVLDEGTETEAGEETGDGRCDGEPAAEFEFNVIRSTFIRTEDGDTCPMFGVDVEVPAPCEELDFGAFIEHPVYGTESIGSPAWASTADASHLLIEFDDAAVRPLQNDGDPPFDSFEGVLRVPVRGTDEPVNGELLVLQMESGQEHAWFPGMMEGGPALPGTTVFAYRVFDSDTWQDDEPLKSAFSAAVLKEPLGDLSPDSESFIEKEIPGARLLSFFTDPANRHNGMIISALAPAPGVIVDTDGIELIVTACPR